MKIDKYPLAVEQSNYLTKIVNVYIVCDLILGQGNPTDNLQFKNSLSGAAATVKNSDKEKYTYTVDME